MNSQKNTVNVTFVQPDGREETYQGPIGDHVMDVAVDNGVAGIIGQCGGGCTCCTCHVWVDERWQDRVRPAHVDETELLSYAIGVSDRSRLACQVRLTEDLDGLVVEIPSEVE